MDLSLFQKGIDGIVRDEVTGAVGFHVLGEPLLYPHIYDAITYAKGKGLRTEMHTNGSLLTEDRVEALIQAGLDSLSISVQILLASEHECRGAAIPFHLYYRRAMEAIRLIRDSRSDIEVVLCVMDTSTVKLFDVDNKIWTDGKDAPFKEKVISFLLDLQAAPARAVSRRQIRSAVGRWGLPRPRLLRIDDRVQVYVHPFGDWGNAFTTRKVHPAKLGTCGYALSNIGVLSDGTVTICCVDYDGRTSPGNLRSESLASLLSSERVEAIRRGFRRARVVHPYCQRCMGSPYWARAVIKCGLSIFLFRLLKFQPAGLEAVPLTPS